MAGKAKPQKQARPARPPASLIRPGLLTAAGALFWAAAHQPAVLSPASASVWGLETVTAALLIRAGLACLEPAIRLLVLRLRAAMPGRDTP
jgi:hypothetical protein